MGAKESSLYHKISATESSGLAGLISQARLTLPLITAEFNMEAAVRLSDCISVRRTSARFRIGASFNLSKRSRRRGGRDVID